MMIIKNCWIYWKDVAEVTELVVVVVTMMMDDVLCVHEGVDGDYKRGDGCYIGRGDGWSGGRETCGDGDYSKGNG